MLKIAALLGALLGVVVLYLVFTSQRAERAVGATWDSLVVPGPGTAFDPAMVAELPEPARRFLLYAIEPGTPLAGSVELAMTGHMLLSPDGDPLPMEARQILSPPAGFVWAARARMGPLTIGGYDVYARGEGAMRWSILRVIPVMRVEGPDVTRSAAGRLAMEGIMLPSSLLPGGGVIWEEAGEHSVRFTTLIGEESVTSLLEVDSNGRPVRVSAQRWSPDAGPGYDEFVVEMTGEMRTGEYTLPLELEAGWRLGSPDEFRFFRATLTSATHR